MTTHPDPDQPPIDLATPRRVHLVGIGGAGMSGLARLLLQRGHHVSGSDMKDGRALVALRQMGATVTIGHDAEAVGDAEVVVRSTAVPFANPELARADELGLPVIHRAELLAALLHGQRGVLIAGTHGKTTTTSMAVVALQAAGADPSYAIGGSLNETGSNAHAGDDDVFVAEADESDRTFLMFRPAIAVVTNVELDHPDEYVTEDDVDEAFLQFLAHRPGALGDAGDEEPGVALLCIDDPGVQRLVPTVRQPIVTYGRSPEADVRLLVGASGTDGARVRVGDRTVPLQLGVPGLHNLLNATAALAVCHLVGADLERAAAGLVDFTGAQRRFQRLGVARGVEVVDDYAHHPTELGVTIAAARTLEPSRVVVVVQPHRYSRTQALGEALGRAAAAADLVVVTDVYASSEAPIPGVSGQLVADAAREAGAAVVYEPHLADVPAVLAERTRSGDLVVVTGAGDVNQVGPALLDLLEPRA